MKLCYLSYKYLLCFKLWLSFYLLLLHSDFDNVVNFGSAFLVSRRVNNQQIVKYVKYIPMYVWIGFWDDVSDVYYFSIWTEKIYEFGERVVLIEPWSMKSINFIRCFKNFRCNFRVGLICYFLIINKILWWVREYVEFTVNFWVLRVVLTILKIVKIEKS